MSRAPITFAWTDEGAFVPLGRFKNECDRRFVIGQHYLMEEIESRSWESHAHMFAWLKTAWENLPEDIADQFPSPNHLRKRALIDAGFFTETITDTGSNAAALRVASLVKGRDGFAVVIVRGPLVIVRDAMTQKMIGEGAPDKKKFQQMKTDVLSVVADLIGVTPECLTKNARAA